jgi:hypothetical protein
VSTLAFAPRRGGGQAAGAAPIVRVVLARAALAAGVWLLAGPGWALLVAGLLVATWPKWAAR